MEEEMTMTVEGQGESGVTGSFTKKSRGKPKGSKKLQVWVTQMDLPGFSSSISNGEPTQPRRSRGRPKKSGNKHKVQKCEQVSLNPPRGQGRPKGSVKKKLAHNAEASGVGNSTRKRGRPKGSTNRKTLSKVADGADDWDFTIDGSFQPKRGRGRPKRSTLLMRSAESSKSEEEEEEEEESDSVPPRKRESSKSDEEEKEEEEGDSVQPRKRGRPKGSPNKKPKLAEKRDVCSDWESQSNSFGESPVKVGRGRPRKILMEDDERGVPKQSEEQNVPDGSQPGKRGPGRPKGSPNKTFPLVHRSDGRPRKPNLPFIHTERLSMKPKGRGRPKKEMQKRGRPRKTPLPPPGDVMGPKVWKPLGRPRKYPRPDPTEGPPPAPPRARGRPRKVEIKRGFQSRKASAQPMEPSEESPRPRGRPLGAIKDTPAHTPARKRGRPKGSLNKPKVANQTEVAEQEWEEEAEEEGVVESDEGTAAETG